MLDDFVQYSGGAIGSDQFWEGLGRRYHVHTIVYQLKKESSPYYEVRLPTPADCDEAQYQVMIANSVLHRKFPTKSVYADGLILRNWCQVRESAGVFAIGRLDADWTIVDGGTGWAVQMGIHAGIPVYVFDYQYDHWFFYNTMRGKFSSVMHPPVLTNPFTGIGTRGEEMNDEPIPADWIQVDKKYRYPLAAVRAIKAIYESTDQFIRHSIA